MPQRKTLQKPPLQLVEQSPGPVQAFGAAAILCRFLAASDGAIDIAIATAAIAPTARNFVIDFIIIASSPF
jgi:hypothetical protein